MSDVHPRIIPRHRSVDFERLAAAILDLALLVDGDEDSLELGEEIHARLTARTSTTMPEEKSA